MLNCESSSWNTPPLVSCGSIDQMIDLIGHGARESLQCTVGAEIYLVNNRNDSGSGSLRDAVESPTPRVIIFNVGGEIALQSPLRPQPCKAILGRAAPGEGISLRYTGSNGGNHVIQLQNTSDIYAEHLTLAGVIRDPLAYYGVQRVAMNHVSVYGGLDEVVDSFFNTNLDLSLLNSIVSMGIADAGGSRGLIFQSSDGSQIGGSSRLTIARNLMIHNSIRSPNVTSWQDFDIRENWIKDFGNWATEIHSRGHLTTGNVVNNCYDPGPTTGDLNSTFGGNIYLGNTTASDGAAPSSIYQLYIEGNEDHRTPGSARLVQGRSFGGPIDFQQVNERFDCPWPDTLLTPQQTKDHLTPIVGHSLPARGQHDQNIINQAVNNTSLVVTSASQFNQIYIPRINAQGDTRLNMSAVDYVPASWKRRCGGLEGSEDQLNQINTNEIATSDGFSLFHLWVMSGQPA